MKNILNSILFLSSILLVNAQVGIEKTSVGVSSLLEFGRTDSGMQLPTIATVPAASGSYLGAVIVEQSTNTIKWCDGVTWIQATETGSVPALATGRTELSNNGVIISGTGSSSVGSLILSSTNKALVLPLVNNPAAVIVSPVAGTICYDTNKNRLAIFNGSKWDYWW